MVLSDLKVAELSAIGRALQRLGSDAYGRFEDCGAAIPFDRLKAEPQAERCVPCAQRREGQHAR